MDKTKKIKKKSENKAKRLSYMFLKKILDICYIRF